MKKLIVGLLAVTAFTLTACSNNSETKSTQGQKPNSSVTSKKKSSTKASSKKQDGSQKQTTTSTKEKSDQTTQTSDSSQTSNSDVILRERKLTGRSYKTNMTEQNLERLKQYMNQFGLNMNQKYEQVTFDSNSSWYNVNLSDYAKENRSININGQSYKTNWFNTRAYYGTRYIPAAYVDDSQHILYLFVADEGSIRVLVSQQAPNSNGELVLKDTSNQSLLDAFMTICGGGVPDTSSSTSQDTASTSDSETANATTDPDNPPLYTIPSEYTGTWYSADGGVMTLKGTTMTFENADNPKNTATLYQQSDEALEAALNKSYEAGDGDTHPERAFAHDENSSDGKHYLFIRGWVSNGSSEAIYMTDELVAGQQVRVLNFRISNGADLVYYYPSKAIADSANN